MGSEYSQFSRDTIQVWDPETDNELVCRAVWPETADAKTFQFVARGGGAFRFKPGQYMTFEFNAGSETFTRCYTLASPPTRPFSVEITVKRKEAGPVSTWVYDHLKSGAIVKASPPIGDFSIVDHPADKYLLLSAGSGITPVMSMARALRDLGSAADVVFIHSARSYADIIFRRESEALSRQMKAFAYGFAISGALDDVRARCHAGRLNRTILSTIAPDLQDREIFCCGPESYMADVRAILSDLGADAARYHEESFDFSKTSSPQTVEEGQATGATDIYRVTFAKSGKTVECGAETNILEAASKAGLRLPSSCTKGVCGTCKSRKLSGDVDMVHGGGIRKREIDQGLILICCSKPRSDVVIDR